ncbi:histidine kinase dimerization/phospho-acceptor domain-containing protein, partial [Actinoplanes subtropicus]|uniref:histidine kinase dimerization/phospho-acceptor domain-containing protein n=1 Tax=Actinoplanes subtropicus TaxID=543632 RepID=UPI00248064E5
MSLRTKLVASVLVLVFAALLLISLASTYALHRYLITRMDDQLRTFAESSVDTSTTNNLALTHDWAVVPPDYLAAVTSVSGVGDLYFGGKLTSTDLPIILTGVDAINAHTNMPYTTPSANGKYMWRMLVIRVSNDSVLHVGQRMTGTEEAVGRLVRADILVGVGVLIALAAVGAALVRQSLIPLFESEAKMRQFVADASHELRTPLTTIRGFAELYRQGAVSDPEDVAKLVRRIEDEAARMGLLVEDLLLLARLDRER